MFSFLGKLFGTDKAAASLIDNASKALDSVFYTDEEEAADKAKSVTEARTMVIKWLESTQGQNLSRRLIALSITAMWLLPKFVSMCLCVAQVWIEDAKDTRLIESATLIGDYSEGMTSAMMLILAFYFAAPEMGKIAGVALERFSKNK